MPQIFKIDRPVRLEVRLPTSLKARLDLELYSELEGGVPHGKMSALFAELVEKWLEERKG